MQANASAFAVAIAFVLPTNTRIRIIVNSKLVHAAAPRAMQNASRPCSRVFLAAACLVWGLLAVRAAAAPFAYIGNHVSNSVSVIDTATNTVTATIPVGSNPYGVAVNPAGTRVYVTNLGDASVSVIDTSSNTVIATVTVGSGPTRVAVHPTGSRVYVSNYSSGTVTVVDANTNTVSGTISVGGQPMGIQIDAATARAYVANWAANTVSVIDTVSNAVVATVNLSGSNPLDLAVTPDGSKVFVSNHFSSNVSVIDTASNTETTKIAAGANPTGVWINPPGNKVFVTHYGSGNVMVINPATNGLITDLTGFAAPVSIEETPDGARLYVVNQNGNNVSVLNAADYSLLTTVAVGSTPLSYGGHFIGPLFAFNPQTGMPLNTPIVSNPVSVTGGAAAISIAGGEYRINGGSWTASTGAVATGDTVAVRQVSSGSYSTMTSATLTIGGASGAFAVTTAAADDPNASGLVSWWKADNNTYDSVGGNHGTPANGASFAAGRIGPAFTFDGVDDLVRVLDPKNLPAGNAPRTISAWISSSGTTSGNRYQGIVGYGLDYAGLGSGNSLFFEWGGDNVANRLFQMNLISGGASESVMQFNTWYHVALTHDGSVTRLFINGRLEHAAPMIQNTVIDPAVGLSIGKSPLFDSWHAQFNGLIDDVKVFNRVLSSLDLSTLAGTRPDPFSFISQTGMPLSAAIVSNPVTVTIAGSASAISIAGGEYRINSGAWVASDGSVTNGDSVVIRQTSSGAYATLTTATLTIGGVSAAFNVTTVAAGDANANGLVAWWKADNNAYDSVGGNHGTPTSGATYAAGLSGAAFSFDGADDYVDVPNSSSINFGPNQPMSISLWARRTSANVSQIVFSKRAGCGAQAHYQLQWYEAGNWFAFSTTGGLDNGTYTTPDKLPLNAWTLVTITFDGATATIYINGLPASSHVMTLDPADVPLRLGGEPSCGQSFGGLLDDVKIFNRALSPIEVAAASGLVPDAFNFAAQAGVTPGTFVVSNTITVTGISHATAISIAGGEYSVSSDAGTSWSPYSATVPASVNVNDQVRVRQTASASYATLTSATLTVGGVSAAFNVTTVAATTLTAVVSRKTHATLGPFDLDIDRTRTIDQAITVEPRIAAGVHQIVFKFDTPISQVGSATVAGPNASPAGSATASFAGNEVTVTLTGVPDNQRVTVSVAGVNGGAGAEASIGFLIGDMNGSRSVNASDISAIKAHLQQPTTLANFQFDLNLTGTVSNVDVAAVKARAGWTMP